MVLQLVEDFKPGWAKTNHAHIHVEGSPRGASEGARNISLIEGTEKVASFEFYRRVKCKPCLRLLSVQNT
jgi:hypothetical protein